MTARTEVRMPVVASAASAPYITTPAGHLEATLAALSAELEPCEWCNEEDHWITCRAEPHPGVNPPPGVITELVEVCSCCMVGAVGHPERGLLARLRRESADDRDIAVEVLSPEGRWL